MKVCLDPGHAASTAGKRSFDGRILEFEFNRDVAERIRRILEQHGVEVTYSCDVDIEYDTPVSVRAYNANQAEADIFVSIHANAYGETWNSANGWEVFVCGRGGKAEKLAKEIEKESIPYLGIRNRGVKVGQFVVLTDTTMPAVLIEHGFYTNKEECELLTTNEFRQKCAVADAKGILNYFGIEYVDAENIPSKWAREAWEWAKSNKICDGTRPRDCVTREEAVVMLQRLMKAIG